MQNYPNNPGHKTGGTSEQAAIEMQSKAATLRNKVLTLLKQPACCVRGLTADEAAELLKESPLSIRPRFSELLAAGHIRDSGKRRENYSGKMATVWIASFKGEQFSLGI